MMSLCVFRNYEYPKKPTDLHVIFLYAPMVLQFCTGLSTGEEAAQRKSFASPPSKKMYYFLQYKPFIKHISISWS